HRRSSWLRRARGRPLRDGRGADRSWRRERALADRARAVVRLLALLLLVAPLSLRADALTDLRVTLAQLAANTPAHGSFDVTSTSTNSDEGHAFEGKASVGFEVSDAGLRILYPKATLAQTNQEARLEAADP